MTELSNAEVGAIVRQRMKQCGLTERSLRVKADVDRKTLAAILDGSRWPQEDTRLKVERALRWEAGSIDDIRAGGTATPIASKPVSPLKIVSDEDLLAELVARMRAYRNAMGRQELQDRSVGAPSNWVIPFSEEPSMLGDHDGEQRHQPGG